MLALFDLFFDVLCIEFLKELLKRWLVMYYCLSILCLCVEVFEVEVLLAKGRVSEMVLTLVLDIMNVLLDNGCEGFGVYIYDFNVEYG